MPKEYSTKFKTEVIKRYQNGESILALSQELRIAQSTIYHWRKEFCSIKAANRIYTPKEFDALSRRLEKLEHEMEIIKRSGYIADVPLQKKLSVLENIYRQADNTYSVHELCEALDIARGTFYNYIFAAPIIASGRKRRSNLCDWYSRSSMIVPSDSALKRFVSLWPGAVSGSAPNALRQSCRNWGCKASVQTRKSNTRSSNNTKSKICWNASLLQTIRTRSGSAILHTSKSMITGCISASSSIFSHAESSIIEYPAMPVQIWSPAHSEPLSGNAAIPVA